MGCRYFTNDDGEVVFYCSTTGWAFGPVMRDEDEADRFSAYLGTDPRKLTLADLGVRWDRFLDLEKQYIKEKNRFTSPEPDAADYAAIDLDEFKEWLSNQTLT